MLHFETLLIPQNKAGVSLSCNILFILLRECVFGPEPTYRQMTLYILGIQVHSNSYTVRLILINMPAWVRNHPNFWNSSNSRLICGQDYVLVSQELLFCVCACVCDVCVSVCVFGFFFNTEFQNVLPCCHATNIWLKFFPHKGLEVFHGPKAPERQKNNLSCSGL